MTWGDRVHALSARAFSPDPVEGRFRRYAWRILAPLGLAAILAGGSVEYRDHGPRFVDSVRNAIERNVR